MPPSFVKASESGRITAGSKFSAPATASHIVRPVTLGIYQYLGTQVQNWNAVMATAVLSAIPAIVLLVAAQKYIAAGAIGGAVK